MTAKCHQGFGDIGPNWIAHKKGWMTGKLLMLMSHGGYALPSGAPSIRCQIQVGGPHQPMGFHIIGVLKRKQSRLHDDVMRSCPGRAGTEADAVRATIDAWEQVDARVVKSTWRCFFAADRGDE